MDLLHGLNLQPARVTDRSRLCIRAAPAAGWWLDWRMTRALHIRTLEQAWNQLGEPEDYADHTAADSASEVTP